VKRRIAILLHEAENPAALATFGVTGMAEVWREHGHEVVNLFGTSGDPDADLVFVHVDVSEVPEAYLAFAARFPRAVNGRVKDIRKSTFSAHLLGRQDAWEGPVIVKSDRNYGGYPEARKGITRLDGHGLRPLFPSPSGYTVHGSLQDVPPEVFASPDLVVERFLPELEDGLFHVRSYQFLGDRGGCVRTASREPIVKSETAVARMPARPHPEVLALRERLGFDYGKFDYVERDGEAIILDLNKTLGVGRGGGPLILEGRRNRAEGLYAFFQRGAAPGVTGLTGADH